MGVIIAVVMVDAATCGTATRDKEYMLGSAKATAEKSGHYPKQNTGKTCFYKHSEIYSGAQGKCEKGNKHMTAVH